MLIPHVPAQDLHNAKGGRIASVECSAWSRRRGCGVVVYRAWPVQIACLVSYKTYAELQFGVLLTSSKALY